MKHSAISAMLLLAALAPAASAQSFPGKPIRLVVGFTPGGGVER